jgi:hypothetical protein
MHGYILKKFKNKFKLDIYYIINLQSSLILFIPLPIQLNFLDNPITLH